MNNFSVLDSDSAELILDIDGSAHIRKTLGEIIHFLESDSRTAVFQINGVTFNLRSDSDDHLVYTEYTRNIRDLTSSSIVGPYPPIGHSLDDVTDQTKNMEYMFDG
jgi:hypothetical protein